LKKRKNRGSGQKDKVITGKIGMKKIKCVYCTLIVFTTTYTCGMESEAKYHAFFDTGIVFDYGEHNKLQRANLIATKLFGESAYFKIAKLTGYIGWYLGVNPARESAVQDKVFAFLRTIPTEGDYPDIYYQERLVPPLIIAWQKGDISGEEAQKKIGRELAKRRISDKELAFYSALGYGTFDSEVMTQTCTIDEHTKKTLKLCLQHNIACHLIGNHADPIAPLQAKYSILQEAFEDRTFLSGERRMLSPYPEFFDSVVATFPTVPEKRIYIASEDPAAPSEYFDATRAFSSHIYPPSSDVLRQLLTEK